MTKQVVLKNGVTVELRNYDTGNMEDLVKMYASLSSETVRWGLPPYDRVKVERLISNLENKINIVAWTNSEIVGHLQIFTVPINQLKGIGELLIYLRDEFQNIGLGTAMMNLGIQQARTRGWHRIGLTVIANNRPAIRSYEKVGFKKEGVRHDSYYGSDGKYHDSVEMGLVLV